MLKVIISGCNGSLGRDITRIASEDPELDIVAGFVHRNMTKYGSFPVYADPMEFGGYADVLVDCSVPSALDGGLLGYATEKKLSLVLCTTGYTNVQLDMIREASKKIPIFKSGNMSIGINLLADLVKRACAFLGYGFDVEIIERHHRRKVDAPSGTALMLADAANSALPYDAEYVFERQNVRQPRSEHEIGVSSFRGGTIVGEHEIVFAGLDEVIEIKHTAYSREIYATGAVRAAKFMAGIKKPGIYDMQDLLSK